MKVELRLPSNRGGTPQEQIAELRSYLFQLVTQLQFILSNLPDLGEADLNTPGENNKN